MKVQHKAAAINNMFNAFELSESKRIEKKAHKAFRNARKTRKYVWNNAE